MRHAHAHDVPVPEVVLQDTLQDHPVLVTTWNTGEPALDALHRSPRDAREIGWAMGTALGLLHRVTAPDVLDSGDRWLKSGRVTHDLLGSRLSRMPHTDRLLHLDYHPNNVLIDSGAVTAIIDWENTMSGPPHVDVARTRAICLAVTFGGLWPPALTHMLELFEDGLVSGHAEVVGPDPHPQLSAAWGMAMTVDDLANQAKKPGSWVTKEVLGRLRDERDRLIMAAMDR